MARCAACRSAWIAAMMVAGIGHRCASAIEHRSETLRVSLTVPDDWTPLDAGELAALNQRLAEVLGTGGGRYTAAFRRQAGDGLPMIIIHELSESTRGVTWSELEQSVTRDAIAQVFREQTRIPAAATDVRSVRIERDRSRIVSEGSVKHPGLGDVEYRSFQYTTAHGVFTAAWYDRPERLSADAPHLREFADSVRIDPAARFQEAPHSWHDDPVFEAKLLSVVGIGLVGTAGFVILRVVKRRSRRRRGDEIDLPLDPDTD